MQIKMNFDLSSLNTLQLATVAKKFIALKTEEDLKLLFRSEEFKSQPLRILGAGSNLVLPQTIEAFVVKLENKGHKDISEDSNYFYVKAQAGESWDEFVQWTLTNGYYGLENLSLIPGTVGAAPIQNIGAYGVEAKDFLWEVQAFDLQNGNEKIFSNSECQFSYRDSFFKKPQGSHYLIWTVTFRFPKKNSLHIEYGDIRKEIQRLQLELSPQSVAKAVTNIRQSKIPDYKVIGNAGSFFKNPIVYKSVRDDILTKYSDLISYPHENQQFKLAAGWLIEKAGWKGRRLGPVGMYEKQALVLVNHGGATADDVWKLAEAVSQDVHKIFGVTLEAEPVRW